MKKTVLIFLLMGSVGIAYGGGTHQGGHHLKDENAHWQAPQEAIVQVNPIPADSDSVERGRLLYIELCSRCHGGNALGNGPDASSLSTKPTNLKAMSGGHADGDFAWKIKNGRNEMPAWGEDLENEEIWDLVNYVQSLSKGVDSNILPSHKSSNHTEHTH